MSASSYHIRCIDTSKNFDGVTAVKHVNLEIERGKTTVIMGGSGSGKTTLLRLMTGLLPMSSGDVLLDGHSLKNISSSELYKLRLSMGMVFQYSALLNSLNTFENIAFPVREHTKLDESVIETMVTMALEQVGLRGMEKRMPSELSGGMAKRVALARAIIMSPQLIFYDEPTSGLDPISVGVISGLIKKLADAMNITSVVVSHDVEASLKIADHVLLLWQSELVASGTVEEIRSSRDPRVLQFLQGKPDGPIPFSQNPTAYLDDIRQKPYH